MPTEQRLQGAAVHKQSFKNDPMDDFASAHLTLQAMSLLREQPPSELAFFCQRRANESNLS